MSELLPDRVQLVAGRLCIDWSDGERHSCSIQELRDACPCAGCREKRRGAKPNPLALPVLTAAELMPLSLTAMTPVGNYAYSIAFSDGHDTGIFTLEQLRALGQLNPSG